MRCHHLKLTPEDLTLWELNRPKLARAISKALGLTSKYEEIGPPRTAQIGIWSADAVPAFLTIQWDEREFRHVVASLVARQQSPFILLAPTASHMDATSQSYLANARAEFFSLETHLTLTDHGTFKPTKAPGAIFSRFLPKEEIPEDVARQAFALIKALDSENPVLKGPVFSVFRLYCMEGLSAEQVAKSCHCGKGTVVNRLRMIRKKTGTDPDKLRAYSSQFESIENSLSDPRARRIDRRAAPYGHADSEE